MKQLRIVGIILSLLVVGLTSVNRTSAQAAPISDGCRAANFTKSVSMTGITMSNQYFMDDDTLHISASAPINVYITGRRGLIFSKTNVTSVTFNITDWQADIYGYTYTITSVDSRANIITVRCSPSPISLACIQFNGWFNAWGEPTTTGDFNAGEKMTLVSDSPISVDITGSASISFPSLMEFSYTFPVSGTYTIKWKSTIADVTAHGTLNCTLPR